MHLLRSIRAQPWILAVLVIAITFALYPRTTLAPLHEPSSESASSTAVVQGEHATTSSTTTAVSKNVASSTPQKAKKASIQATKTTPATPATTSPNEIVRVEDPYATPPLPFESVNSAARSALVNILCETQTTGGLQPISGSGIIVDKKGVILTNAHVAQYVLITQSGRSDMLCTVRTGAPAAAQWVPVVLFVPTPWIYAHAAEITNPHVLGTGEHDYALLYIAASIDGSPLPSSFPAITPDVREAIGFIDDSALVASYPVEFVGSTMIQADLFPVTSITTIQRLMTFGVGSADAISLGGVIGAQSGSSGGGIMNQWSRLIGVITTTSAGATTAERDLHAITTAYIDRDMKAQTGLGLIETLAQDPKSMADAFRPQAAILANRLINAIIGR